MKSYKLVNSREVRQKLYRLELDRSEYFSGQTFVFIDNGICESLCNVDSYNSSELQEITQSDFLALSEVEEEVK